jgi:predicted nucleic acid-binding protein
VRRKLLAAPADEVSIHTPLQCFGEFWRVCTEPRGYGKDPASTLKFLRRWIESAPLLLPREAFTEDLFDSLATMAPRGAAVFDLMIASSAISAGMDEIWTIDQTFPSVSPLEVVRI